MNLRILSFFYLITICLLTGCFSSSEKQAVRAFSDRNYENADKLLSEERLQIPAGRYALDKAYILRGNGHLQLSTAQLKQAYDVTAKIQSNDLLKKEILVNLALNEYLDNDTKAFNLAVQKLKEFLSANDPWLKFFEGLAFYLENDYSQASVKWKGLRLNYLSPWMEAAFQQIFPNDWLEIFTMRASILAGDYSTVRVQLERREIGNEDQSNFLMALTYVQEARQSSPDKSLPLLKTAFSYLEKIPDVQKKFSYDLLFISDLLLNKITASIASNHFGDLPYLVDEMQKWGTPAQLEMLTKNVTGQVNILISKQQWQELDLIAPALDDLITDPKIRAQLGQKFEALVKDAFTNGNFSSAEKLTYLARLFNSDAKSSDSRLSLAVVEEISVMIQQPQFSEENVQKLITFWEKLENSPAQKFQLAQKLVAAARPLWAQKNGGVDAIALMRLAMAISPSNRQDELKRSMEKQVMAAYSLTVAHNEFEKLRSILEAQKLFGLAASILQDPKEIANLEADAELLYKQENYKQAFLIADWIASLDPTSKTALRLAGMSSYQMGEYSRSLIYLRKLPLTSENIAARAAAEFAAGDPQTGRKLLAQIGNTSELATEVYERLAISVMLKGEGSEALGWLTESARMNDEMKAVKFLALYSLQRYAEALDQYHLIPPALAQYEGVLGTAALSAMYLKQYDEAEDYVKELFETGHTKLSKLSPAYKELMRDRSVVPSRNFVAAMYYKLVSKNNEKALLQLKQIQEFEPQAVLEQTDLLIDLGRYEEAQSIMDKIKPIFIDTKKKVPFQGRFWSVYAHLQQERGAYLEAKQAWKYYFSLVSNKSPPDNELRHYANVLFALRQFEEAKNVIHKIPSAQTTSEDLLLLMEIQFHQDEVPELENNAKMLLQKYPSDTYLRLRIAKLLFLTQNNNLYRKALLNIPKPEALDNKAAGALLQLRSLVGEYESALSYFQSRTTAWQDNPLILETLYSILEGMSDSAAAKQVARRVGSVEPTNEAYRIFKIQFGDDDIYNNNLVIHYASLYDKNVLSPTSQLAYALALQEEALENFLKGGKLLKEYKYALNKSAGVLLSLSKSYSDIPELHYYLGQAYYLLGSREEAQFAFEQAIRLDPSYTEALLHLGLIYAETSNWLEASQMLEKAVQYAPNNGLAWRKLGDIQEKLSNYLDALNSYAQAAHYRPDDVENYIKLGELNLVINNPEQSIALLDKALAKQPDNIKILSLLLKALYDENLRTNGDKINDIIQRQQNIYERLYKLDPQGAVPLRKKLIENWNK
ncbi:MAG: DUF1347 family protein [Parachlamydiales bacterium]